MGLLGDYQRTLQEFVGVVEDYHKELTNYVHLRKVDLILCGEKNKNFKKIADQLNNCYHDGREVRTPETVRVNLYNYRKSLDDAIARGLTPWGESKQIERLDNPLFDLGSEIELAYFLSQCPDHQRGSQVNNKKINPDHFDEHLNSSDLPITLNCYNCNQQIDLFEGFESSI